MALRPALPNESVGDYPQGEPYLAQTRWPSGITEITHPSALVCATAIAVVSLFSIELIQIVSSESLAAEVFVGYTPVLLGCVSIWLCYRGYRRATRKS